MKIIWVVSCGVLLSFYGDSAIGDPADSNDREVGSAPIQGVPSSGSLSAVEENPNASPHGNDRHYTDGIELSYTSGPLSENGIWNAPIRLLDDCSFLFHRQTDETDSRLEWTILGQSIFTPQNHVVSDPSRNDRPYAGWLYTGLDYIQDLNAQQLTSLQLLGGIVGPWALGRQVQNNVHALFGERLARGWNHQLGNEFGFTVSWERKWRFNHELGDQYSWEFLPEAGITAGNVFTFAEAGFVVRWGRGLKADWGPEMISPGYSGTSYFSSARAPAKLGWDLFFGTQARAVAWNIFLDGNTFQNSRSVAKEPVVDDLILGVELFSARGMRFGFSLVVRTPEFRKQRGVDDFGSFDARYAF